MSYIAKACAHCGALMVNEHGNAKICGDCRASQAVIAAVKCCGCGKEFAPDRRGTKHCSRNCKDRAARRGKKRIRTERDKETARKWRAKNKAKRTAQSLKARREQAGLRFRKLYIDARKRRDYRGTMEEYADWLERWRLDRIGRDKPERKPRPVSPVAGMSEAEKWRYYYRTDPAFRTWARHRNQFKKWLKGEKRTNTLARTVDYSRDELVRHLERQFVRGMSWANMGKWHIDHIKPKNLFDPTNPDDVRACWALPNLRPLWASENCGRDKRGRDVLL